MNPIIKQAIEDKLKEFDEKWPHQASVMFERNNIKDFLKKSLEEISELCNDYE